MPPFEDRIDPALFFSTPEIEEALAALEYECFHGKGALSLIGEAGTGKTLLVRRFLASIRTEDQVVVWTCPCGTESSLLREVCKSFKIGVPASQDPSRMLDRLRRHLKKKDAPADARRPVLILDQVENLSPRALTELVDLANLTDDAGRMVSLILVGRPRFRDILAGPEFDGLRQMLFGGRTLPPLTRGRTREYVLYRLRFAGSGDRPLFDERALDLVFDLSGGIPRLVNEICDAAMLAAYGAGEAMVSAAVLRSLDPLSTAADDPLPEPAAEFSDLKPSTSRTPKSAAPAVSRPLRDVAPACAAQAGESMMPTATAPMVRPVQWLVESGEHLLDRLEEALLRAERFSERAENAFEKYSRAEERIAQQVRRADRLTDRLGTAAEDCRTAIRDADARTEAAANDLNRRAVDCEQRSAGAVRQLAEKISEATALSDRVERAERELSTRLKTLDARLDDLPRSIERIDEFQHRADQLAARLTSIHQTADQSISSAEQSTRQLQVRLDAGLLRAAESVARLESRIDHPVENAERRLAELTAEVSTLEKRAASWQESLNVPAGRLKSLEAQSAAIHQRIAQLTQISEQLRQGTETTDAAMNDQVTRQQRQQAEFQRAKNTLEELENRNSTLAVQTAELQQRLTDFAGDLQRAEVVATTVTDAVSAAKESTQTLTEAAKNADESARIARDLTQTLNASQSRVASEVEAAQRACKETAATRQALEQTHGRLVETVTTAEAAINTAGIVSTTLQTAVTDAGRTHDILTESVYDAGNVARNLETAAEEAGKVAENLTNSRQQAECTDRQLSEMLAAAASTTPGLQSATAAATAILSSLQDAESSSRHATKVCEESRRALEESAEKALKKVFSAADSLREALAESETAVARIQRESENADRFVHQMTELHARLDESRARTDQQLSIAAKTGDSLTAATARATDLSAAMRQTNDAAAAMLERANAMVGCAEQTVRSVAEQIGAASAEVWSLSKNAGPLLDRIRESRESVTGLEERFGQTLSRAEESLGRLREALDTAARRETSLSAGCEQAARLTEDLGEVSRVLAAAGELESRLRGQLEEAHTIADALATVAETTPRNVELLQELNERGARLVAEQVRLQETADHTLRRFAEQLQDRENRISDGDRILTEFLERANEIARHVRELQHQLEKTDRAVKTAAHGEASAIVAEAKTQSVQLARVCNAVRKVAASLARQTLDARDQTQQLEQHRRAAADEIRRLLAETRDAARTLGTWANEGLRVQTRLESVIRECPPLENTHSAASLRRAAQTAQRLEHLTPSPSEALEINAPSGEPPLPDSPARAAARTDQIARLIQEARSAHALETLGA